MPERLEAEISAVLDKKVRSLLWTHNGNIELAGIEEGSVVRLRLLGACTACIGVEQTVNDVIVAGIRESCPWVSNVRVETGISDELVQEAPRFLKRPRE